jgi:hypothetical protein
MGEGFIVRRGGGGQQTVKPIYNSLTEVGFTSLTLNVTNDSNSIATLYYSVVQTEPGPTTSDTFDTEFAGKETKDITITGLTGGTTYTVYLKAIAVGEVLSETVIVPNLTTGVAMNATGGTTFEYNLTSSPTKRYRSHTFTGNGTFQVTQLSNMGSTFNQVDYLIIAGGGGGGNQHGSGGGAGGYRTTNGTSGGNSAAETKPTVQLTNYTVTVGTGGAGIPGGTGGTYGFQGNPSSIVGSAINITTTGGGGGGSWCGTNQAQRHSGGSGGGAHPCTTGGFVTGGAGIAGQGFKGGDRTTNTGAPYVAQGGGGAGGVGVNGVNLTNSGDGGPGLANLLRTGSNETRAGGGGGGIYQSTGQVVTLGFGGSGGGGTGGVSISESESPGGNGTVNTGSGGGGAGRFQNKGGDGGSGIVIIRYEIAPTS